MLFNLFPREGDKLFSNRRTPMLLLERDSSGVQHDMLFACCDPWLYRHYGCAEGHANCRDNFLAALREIGVETAHVPNPLNLWMNIPVAENSKLSIEPPGEPRRRRGGVAGLDRLHRHLLRLPHGRHPHQRPRLHAAAGPLRAAAGEVGRGGGRQRIS